MAKIINCAHRGAMAAEPENTLRAFRRAAEMGADQVELDVILTADGVPMVSHDARAHTEPKRVDLRRMKMDAVLELRFRGEPIPTLQEAVDVCKETGMMVNIEIKDWRAVPKTVDLVRKNNLYEQCQISNFHIAVLRAVKALDHKVPTGYLVLPGIQWVQMRIASAAGCESVNPLFHTVNDRFSRAARSRGLKIFVWTVNRPEDMRKMIEAGVDGVITNKPDVFAGVKKEMGVE